MTIQQRIFEIMGDNYKKLEDTKKEGLEINNKFKESLDYIKDKYLPFILAY